MQDLNVESTKLSQDTTSSLIEQFFELFQQENLRHSWPWTIFFILTYFIIFIVGIVGNFIVIFVFCRRRQMRSITNMFLVNLAVADLFVILFCVPVTLNSTIFVHWNLGTFMCKGVAYIQGISVFASAYSLAVISAERCKAIYRFMPVIDNLTKFQAILIITVIWTTAFIILLPWPIVFEVTPMQENGSILFCVETWSDENTGKMYFLFGNVICCYAIPGSLICITNSQVCWKVSHRKIPIGLAYSRSIKKYHQKVRSGVTKMLSLVTFTFLLSWLPLYIVMCRVKFTSVESMSETEMDILDVLIPIVQLLGASNSCVNPLLYAFINPRFRDMSRSVFCASKNCSFTCLEKFKQRRNSQRSSIVSDNHLRNIGSCRDGKANSTIQDVFSTGSTSLTQGSSQCRCTCATKISVVFTEKKPCQCNRPKVATYFHVRQQIQILKYSKETSV